MEMPAIQQSGQYRVEEEGSRARRHNQALVALARQVWTRHCTLESALSRICETAADTLEVERVNVWRLHPEHGLLRCVHAYDRRRGVHNPPGYDEAFDAHSEYGRRLDEVRVLDAADVHRDETLSASHASLGDYFARNDIASLLDAPVRCEGILMGVVCHEQVGQPRAWTLADQAFAASIGDFVAMAVEVQRRRAAERRLRYLELHDAQTDLPNRDHLLEVAHSALRHKAGESAITAIHVQVEGGADSAAALVAVAGALSDGLGDNVTLARVRDDAFALIPHRHLREAEALELAGRCIELAERALEGVDARVSAGLAFSHDLTASSADLLLRNAELASQRARSLGRPERCEVFDAGRHRELVERMHVERGLRAAYESGDLHVHYQPVVDLADGRIRGAEALLRWRDDHGGWRATSDFIGVAESSGVIVPVGRWLLGQACNAAAAWPVAESLPPPELAVNISARQLEQPGLVTDVARALETSGLAPARLWLELTESALLPDPGFAINVLERLRALGVRISLDDFGTGHSSFTRLKRLPIDGVKIDRSFVADLTDDPLDMAIVAAVAGVARKAGIAVVAEGVETAAQARALMAIGITAGQGYHYGRAVPEAAVAELMAARS
jgi:EAL domain-containing protein (putative c-di-GMP-specific phosphodiesterase class I)/GGDEF domain-containing protein